MKHDPLTSAFQSARVCGSALLLCAVLSVFVAAPAQANNEIKMASAEHPLMLSKLPGAEHPKLKIVEKDFSDSTVVAQKVSATSKASEEEEEVQPLPKIRLTTMPGHKTLSPILGNSVTPGNAPKKDDASTATATASAQTGSKKQAGLCDDPANKQACDALANYKKKELSAIESDTQTLSALQQAVKDLGLKNKLDLTPEGGAIKATASAASHIDPAPTTKKN